MADYLNPQDLANAKVDAKTLGEAVNDKKIVRPRYGDSYKSIPMLSADGVSAISELKKAIDIAAAAGAGENGWTDKLVLTWSGRTQESKNKDCINIRDFGAIGDGVFHKLSEKFSDLSSAKFAYSNIADQITSLDQSIDWVATQSALNSPHRTLYATDGVFILDAGLSSQERFELSGNAEFKSTKKEMAFFTVPEETEISGVKLNGDLLAKIGIQTSYGGCYFRNIKIKKLKTETTGCVGILANTDMGVTVSGCVIEDLFSLSNTSAGAGGTVRAIQVWHNTPAKKRSTITGNHCKNIQGFEGDAIHVMFQNAGEFPFYDGLVTVKENTIIDFSRRGIKLQAWNNPTLNNQVFNSFTAEQGFPNITSGINVIAGGRNIIKGNIVANAGGSQIAIQGVSKDSGCRENLVIDNIVYSFDQPSSIYFDFCDNYVDRGNIIYDGSGNAISGGASNNIAVLDSIAIGGTGGAGVFITDTTSNAIVRGNIQLGGSRLSGVRLAAQKSIAKDNINLGDGHGVMLNSTAKQSVATGNISSDPNKNTIDSAVSTDIRLAQNTNMNGNAIYGSQYNFHKAPDAASHPNTFFTRGDVIINTNPSALIYGWICSTAGLGGVAVFKNLPTS